MKTWIQFYRLYFVWFSLANIAGIWILFQIPSLTAVFIIKAAFYPAIYLLNGLSARRYFAYFQNLGYTARRLFTGLSLLDFLAFVILTLIINLFRHA